MNGAAMRGASAASGSDPADYRPVSRLAVAAAGLGICSAAALLHPLCWVLPLVAIGLAVAAFADIRRTGRAGGLAALAGLALACGFGAQAVTQAGVERLLAGRRAQAAARLWLDAVRAGRDADAAAMTGGNAAADPAAGAAAPAGAAIRAIQACGPGSDLVAVRAIPDGELAGAWLVSLRLRGCAMQPDIGVQMRLGVLPVPRRGGERWLVTDVAVVR